MIPEPQALREEGRFSPGAFAEQCLDTAQGLLNVLATERSALAGPPPDNIGDIFADKATLAQQLEGLETYRRRVWPGGPDTFVRQLVGDETATWLRYIETLSACREANAINGRLVQARQRHVREALSLLRGGPDDTTYDAAGHRPERAHSVTLGSA